MKKIFRAIFNNSKKDIEVKIPSFIDKGVVFEGNNFVGRFCHLKNTKVGRYSYMGNNCVFTNCVIGSFCSISSNVNVIIGTHPSTEWISTHPIFFSKSSHVGKGFSDINRFNENKKTSNGFSCEIGNDVWIGKNVSILEGIKIGDGAIIGANSLITKDVPSYAIVVGIPGRIKNYRFNDEDIKFLIELKWWEWDDIQIKAMARYFNDIKELRIHL